MAAAAPSTWAKTVGRNVRPKEPPGMARSSAQSKGGEGGNMDVKGSGSAARSTDLTDTTTQVEIDTKDTNRALRLIPRLIPTAEEEETYLSLPLEGNTVKADEKQAEKLRILGEFRTRFSTTSKYNAENHRCADQKFDYDRTYYRCTTETQTHNGYTYTQGINFDDKPFGYTQSSSSFGFYFTDKQNIRKFGTHGPFLQPLRVPKGIPVIKVGDDRWRTPCVFLLGEPVLWQVSHLSTHADKSMEEKKMLDLKSWFCMLGVEVLNVGELASLMMKVEQQKLPVFHDILLEHQAEIVQMLCARPEMLRSLEISFNKTVIFERVSTMFLNVINSLQQSVLFHNKDHKDAVVSASANDVKHRPSAASAGVAVAAAAGAAAGAAPALCDEEKLEEVKISLGYSTLKKYFPFLDEHVCKLIQAMGSAICGSFAMKLVLDEVNKTVKEANTQKEDLVPGDIDIVLRQSDQLCLQDRMAADDGWRSIHKAKERLYRKHGVVDGVTGKFTDAKGQKIEVQLVSMKYEARGHGRQQKNISSWSAARHFTDQADLSFCKIRFDGHDLHVPKELFDSTTNTIRRFGTMAMLPSFIDLSRRWTWINSLVRCVKYIKRGFYVTNLNDIAEQVHGRMKGPSKNYADIKEFQVGFLYDILAKNGTWYPASVKEIDEQLGYVKFQYCGDDRVFQEWIRIAVHAHRIAEFKSQTAGYDEYENDDTDDDNDD